MTFDEYQKEARTTAIYKEPIIYPTLGLSGEAGEVADKVKKVLRDNNGEFDINRRTQIAQELGDVLWYLANLAQDIGFDLGEIARANLAKLKHRQKTGQLKGSGDER
jgi:NTP pyrophosphatase (non-canonical NTP hydrolase)